MKTLTGVEVMGMPKARLAVVVNNILNEVYSIAASLLRVGKYPMLNGVGVLRRALGALAIRFTVYNAEQCHQA